MELDNDLYSTSTGLKLLNELDINTSLLNQSLYYEESTKDVRKTEGFSYSIKVSGSLKTIVHSNTEVYAVQRNKKWNNEKRKYEFFYSEPSFIPISKLEKGKHFVSFPITRESDNPLNITNEEAWIIGRYIADGYLQDNKRSGRKNSYNKKIILCIGKHKAKAFEENLKTYQFTKAEERTVYKYIKQNPRLFDLCRETGRGASNKHFPQEYLDLPEPLLRSMLDGYMSGDGSSKEESFSATTVSRKLALTLAYAINKVYKNGCGITYCVNNPTTTIEGRTVNQQNTYIVRFKKSYSHNKRPHTILIDDKIYAPIKQLKELEECESSRKMVIGNKGFVVNNILMRNK